MEYGLREEVVIPHEKRRIIREINANPKVSAPKLASEYFRETKKTANPEIVRNAIRKEGLNGCAARNKKKKKKKLPTKKTEKQGRSSR